MDIRYLGLSEDLIKAANSIAEASCACKKEELIGNQKKLDKNKNGKLDADDFKKLRNEETELEEAATRKDFRMVADLIKSHPDAAKRKELAQHHAEIFKKQNPRFDHGKFMSAAGVNEEVDLGEGYRTDDLVAAVKHERAITTRKPEHYKSAVAAHDKAAASHQKEFEKHAHSTNYIGSHAQKQGWPATGKAGEHQRRAEYHKNMADIYRKEEVEHLEEATSEYHPHGFTSASEKKAHADKMKKEYNVQTSWHDSKAGGSEALRYHGSARDVSAASDHISGKDAPSYHREETELEEGRQPGPTAGTRKVASYGDDKHTAEVRYNPEYKEYSVHHYKNGKHQGEDSVSYHYDDKEDAHDTAKHEVARTHAKEELEIVLEDYTVEEIEEFMMSEDYDQLDELSKATLGSYINKAAHSVGLNRAIASTHFNRGYTKNAKPKKGPSAEHSREVASRRYAKMDKREAGISKAVGKLTKEQVEEIEALAAKHGLGE